MQDITPDMIQEAVNELSDQQWQTVLARALRTRGIPYRWEGETMVTEGFDPEVMIEEDPDFSQAVAAEATRMVMRIALDEIVETGALVADHVADDGTIVYCVADDARERLSAD